MKTRTWLMTFLILSLAALSGMPASAASGENEARQLVAEIRAELRPVEDEIRRAPFLTALDRGKAPLSSLRAFAGEQYNIIHSDLRSNAHMVSRFGATPGAPFFVGLVNVETIALDLLLDSPRPSA